MAWTQLTGLAFDFQSQTFFPQNELDAGHDVQNSGPQVPGENLPTTSPDGITRDAQVQGIAGQGVANQSAQSPGQPSQGPQSQTLPPPDAQNHQNLPQQQ